MRNQKKYKSQRRMSGMTLDRYVGEHADIDNDRSSGAVCQMEAFAPQDIPESAAVAGLQGGLPENVIACEDNLVFMREQNDEAFKLIVTSPPYNLGKEYEGKAPLDTYLEAQKRVIRECVRLLHPEGSLCWQVGNFVKNGEIVPLDTALYPLFRSQGLKLRNRDRMALRARFALLKAAFRAVRDHQLVDERRQLYVEPGPDPGAVQISRETPLQRAEHWQVIRKSKG